MAEDNLLRELASRCNKDYVADGGRVIIKCSKCGIDLVEIWKTKQYVKMKTNVTATCPMCGDKSFRREFVGGFHVGTLEDGAVSVSNMIPGDTIRDGEYIVQDLTIETIKK